MPEIQEKQGLTRRSFVGAMAAAAGSATLMGSFTGCAPTEQGTERGDAALTAPEEEHYVGFCRGCCCISCSFNVTVREGKLVKTEPFYFKENADMVQMCARGHAHPLRTYGSERLRYPMRRVGERGAGQWERITWDEAIDEIAATWNRLIEEEGPLSINMNTGGGGAMDACSCYGSRVSLALGCSSTTSDNDQANAYMTTMCLMQGFWEGMLPGAWEKSNQPEDLYNAKYLFTIGYNATEASPTKLVYYLKAMQEYGVKHTVIEPIYSIFASKADRYISVRPGTDATYLMAMGKIIVDEGLLDIPFMQSQTVAPFLVKAEDGMYLRQSDLGIEPVEGDPDPTTGEPTFIDPIVVRAEDGSVGLPEDIPEPVIRGTFEIEGHTVTTAFDLLAERFNEWTPERASEICGIPPETIVELAHEFAEGPSYIATNNGTDHYGNGQYAIWVMYTLCMITGQFGNKPGTGIAGTYATIPIGVGAFANLWPPDGHIPPGPTFALPRFTEAYDKNISYDGTHDLRTIKSMYMSNTNPVGGSSQTNAFEKIMHDMDLVVVQDVVLSDTACFADIVLPAAGYFEQETITVMYTPWVILNEKAIEPLYESKGDFEIYNLLLAATGHEVDVVEREDWIKLCLDNDSARGVGLTWERLKEEKYVYTHSLETDPAKAFRLAEAIGFKTATRRAQFYFEGLQPNFPTGREFDYMQERLPYWRPPLEAWPVTRGDFPAHENAEKYPLVLVQERDKFRTGTVFTYNPWLLEIDPEPWTKMSPEDAAARGIKDGDYIRHFNDRGEFVSKCYISAAVMPGVIQHDHGYAMAQYRKGFVPHTSSYETDVVAVNQCHYDCLVEVEKYDGEFERDGILPLPDFMKGE